MLTGAHHWMDVTSGSLLERQTDLKSNWMRFPKSDPKAASYKASKKKKKKKKIILYTIHSDHLSRSSFKRLPTTSVLELNQWMPETWITYHIFTHSAALQ